MASNVVFLVPAAASTLLLVLLSIISPIPITADTDSAVVLDVEGNPVQVGVEYYVQVVGGGWIGKSDPSGGLSCPLFAAVRENNHKGEAVKFIPADEREKYIRLSSDVKIDSGFDCNEDGIWKLVPRPIGTVVIGASGFHDSFPHEWFQIWNSQSTFGAYTIRLRGGYVAPYIGGPVLSVTGSSSLALHVIFIKKTTSTVAVPYKATI